MKNKTLQGNRPNNHLFSNIKPVLCLMLMAYAGILYAQTPIVVINQEQNRDILINGVGDPWGGFVLGGHQLTNPIRGVLLKLSQNGDTLFRRFDGFPKSHLDGVMNDGEGNFLAFGSAAIDTMPPLQQCKTYVWFLKVDAGLNVLEEHTYAVPSKYLEINFMNGIRESSGNFVFCALATGDYSDVAHMNDYLMLRTSPAGVCLTTKFIDLGYDDRQVCLASSMDGDSLFLYGEIGFDFGSQIGVHYLDSNFNYLGQAFKYFGGFFMHYAVKRFNANKLLLNGINMPALVSDYVQPGLCYIDNDADALSSFLCQPDTMFCCQLPQQGMDFVLPNEIYVGGNNNLHVWGDYYSPTSYFLTRVDSNLLPQTTWYFGGDMRYTLNSVIASPAGGCVLVGSRAVTPDLGLTNAYLVIIPPPVPEGEEEPTAESGEILVFPNPGHDWLSVENANRDFTDFEMFDGMGRCIQKLPLDAARLSIFTAGLSPGLYGYRATNRDGKSVSGKWIKQ